MELKLPAIHLLPTHLSSDELNEWYAKIPSLTLNASEASFIVGKSIPPQTSSSPKQEGGDIMTCACWRLSRHSNKDTILTSIPTVSQKSRARFELRKLKLCAEEAAPPQDEVPANPRVKRRKISRTEHYGLRSDSDTDSDDGSALSGGETPSKASVKKVTNTRKVVRLAWLQDSMSKGLVLDYGDYLIFEALKAPSTPGKGPQLDAPVSPDLLQRAREIASSSQGSSHAHVPFRHRRDGAGHHKAPKLVPHSTVDEDIIANIPPVPAYLHTSYSCQRSTFVHPPNEAFIEKLKEVRELRAMTGDGVGVRAYSSAIASLSAYPYKLKSPLGTS